MPATTYRFTTRLTVAAPPERVHLVLVDLEHYPDWWRQVRAVASLGPDDALVVCRSVLPYDLELRLHAVAREPDRLEVGIEGPIDGFARWRLTPYDGGTRLDFEQLVQTRGALAWASYLLRPVLRWNHAVMMRGFARGLRQALSDGRGDRTPEPPS
ncbi:MAG: SRPBCC family protein [Marmoricola sp.]